MAARGQAYFTQKIEFFKDFHPIDDKATACVCQKFVCQLPTNDLAVVSGLLDIGKQPKNIGQKTTIIENDDGGP